MREGISRPDMPRIDADTNVVRGLYALACGRVLVMQDPCGCAQLIGSLHVGNRRKQDAGDRSSRSCVLSCFHTFHARIPSEDLSAGDMALPPTSVPCRMRRGRLLGISCAVVISVIMSSRKMLIDSIPTAAMPPVQLVGLTALRYLSFDHFASLCSTLSCGLHQHA